jgi:hypothetical protein
MLFRLASSSRLHAKARSDPLLIISRVLAFSGPPPDSILVGALHVILFFTTRHLLSSQIRPFCCDESEEFSAFARIGREERAPAARTFGDRTEIDGENPTKLAWPHQKSATG